MSSIRALLVDDDACVRQSLAAILKYLGCSVVACSTARQALERAADGRPLHLTFVDRMLQDGDGVELLLRLQHQRLGGKKVLISGYALMREQIPPQVEYVLPKPVRLDDAARLMHRLQLVTIEKLQELGLRHLAASSAPPRASAPGAHPSRALTG